VIAAVDVVDVLDDFFAGSCSMSEIDIGGSARSRDRSARNSRPMATGSTA